MPSSSSPPPGEPIVVVVVLRGEEYHVVAAIEGHELETPEAEHRPGLKRLLKSTHLELNGKVFINTQQAPTWRANCRRFRPGGSLDRLVNFVAACPCPDGLVQDGTQGENEPCIILHQGARSRGYKRCERARAGERVGESERERGSGPARLLPSLLSCVYSSSCRASPLFPPCRAPGHPLL
jgi:hypothetical protein